MRRSFSCYRLLLCTFLVLMLFQHSARAAEFSLIYSADSDRSGSTPLNNALIIGDLFGRLSPETGPAGEDISSVRFYLDGDTDEFKQERAAPYDLQGGSSEARAFDTTDLADGDHSIQTEVKLENGETYTFDTTFTVGNNQPQPNQAPVFNDIQDINLIVDDSRAVTISASDPESDPLTYQVDSALPAFITLTDLGDGSAELLLTPSASDVGTHKITLSVSDGDLSDSKNIEIVVRAIGSAYFELIYSADSDRSGNTPLINATIKGDLFGRLSPTEGSMGEDISSVRFYLDGDTDEFKKESAAPYDLEGGGSEANAFDTTDLDDGSHIIDTQVKLENGESIWFKTPFTVANNTQYFEVNSIASPSPGGAINPVNVLVEQGETSSFDISVGRGYEIASVSGCHGSLSSTTYTNTYTTGPINAACTVSANFTRITYTISTDAGIGGSIAPSSVIVNSGNRNDFAISTLDGYKIESVTGCDGSLTGEVYTTDRIFADCTITARFAKIETEHTVSTNAGVGGAISPGSAIVTTGNTTSFDIAVRKGYEITDVSGCGGSLSGGTYTTGPITAACTVNVTATQILYTVTTNPGVGGDISPSSASVAIGESTSFGINAHRGYKVDEVSGCGGSYSGGIYTTGPIMAACTVSATFTAITYTVSAKPSIGGSLSPRSISVAFGEATRFIITPYSGYEVTKAAGCGGILKGEHYYTGPITADCTVSASFSLMDVIAPTISSVTPVDSTGVGVARDVAPTVTFSENMLSTSIDNSSILLTGPSSSVTGTVSFDGSTQATLTPNAPLALMTQYTATVSKEVTDLFGNPLGSESSWDFTTRDGAWQGAELIETGDAGDALNPQTVIDGSGNALAVWSQRDGSTYSIYANRYTPADGWGTPERIESNNVGNVNHLQIASDGSDNVLVVWRQYDGSAHSIYANRYTSTGGWGSAELIESSSGTASLPQIATDGSGNALAVWMQYDGSAHSIYVNRYTPGAGWGSAELIESGSETASDPQIAIDDLGDALVVWRQYDGSGYSIYANRYTPVGGWGSAELIESSSGTASLPQIAIDDSGNAVAVWRQHNGSAYDIYANRYTSTGGWGAAELIESSSGTASLPQIATDGSGNALAVWMQYDGSAHSIYVNRYTPVGGWGAAELIESSAGTASDPQIGIDGSGNALAVWSQLSGGDNSIYVNRYTPVGGWGSAELIESSSGAASDPQIGIDGSSGNALAVWDQQDPSTGIFSIHANHFK